MAKLKYLFLLLLLSASPVLAYVMSSTNYILERDSLNFSGGLSTSSSYILEGTAGEIGTGRATSTSYNADLGYQQADETAISLSLAATAVMSPNINTSIGGLASTSVDFNVTTNNTAGYTLQIKTNITPALRGASFDFDDYTTTAAIPDYAWNVVNTDAEFGFTAEGTNAADRYKDNGVSCNQAGGTSNTDTCWDKLLTSYVTIAESASPNYPIGSDTVVKFMAEAGSSSLAQPGNYSATIIVLAYTN